MPPIAPQQHLTRSRSLEKLEVALTGGFYIFMSAWFIAPTRSAHHTMVYLAFLLPALLHLIVALVQRDKLTRALKSPVFVSLSAFLLYMAISSTWADFSEGLGHYLERMLMTLIFIYGVYTVTRNNLKHFELALLTSCAVSVGWLIVNLTIFPETAFNSERFTGANTGSHYLLTGALLGSYLILILTFLVNRIDRQPVLSQILFASALAVALFYATLLTESRSALLAIAATGIYLFFSVKHHKRLKYSLIILAAIALVLLAPYAELFIQRGFSQRFEIWGMALDRIWQKPYFGHGFDAEMLLNISNGETLYDAHNLHLENLFEGGIAGLTLWTAFLLTLAIAGWQTRGTPAGRYILALFIYSVIVKSFESRGILSRPTEFWHLLWLGAGLALSEHSRNTQSKELRGTTRKSKNKTRNPV